MHLIGLTMAAKTKPKYGLEKFNYINLSLTLWQE